MAAIDRVCPPPAGAALDDAEDVTLDELEVAGAAALLLDELLDGLELLELLELLEPELPQPAIASTTAGRTSIENDLRKETSFRFVRRVTASRDA